MKTPPTPPTITRREAVKNGFRPLTSPYRPSETEFLKRALADLRGCNVCLVDTGYGPEIWRAATELKSTP
jgi:hypothetical protein